MFLPSENIYYIIRSFYVVKQTVWYVRKDKLNSYWNKNAAVFFMYAVFQEMKQVLCVVNSVISTLKRNIL